MARAGNHARQRGTQAEPQGDEHPWRETRELRPGDALLRKHLFRIVSRPPQGPALWERNGVRVTEAAALQQARAEGGD